MAVQATQQPDGIQHRAGSSDGSAAGLPTVEAHVSTRPK